MITEVKFFRVFDNADASYLYIDSELEAIVSDRIFL